MRQERPKDRFSGLRGCASNSRITLYLEFGDMSATPGKTSMAIKPWVEVVHLHSDVVSEHFSEDIFALDLGPLADDE